MKKYLKKSRVIALTFFLVFATILCCCLNLTPFTQASSIEATHSDNHCHSNKSENTNNSETEDCECHYSNAVLANLNFDFFRSDVILTNAFKETFVLHASLGSIQNDSILHFEHSPPRLYRRSVPLYLENSILRI